jgi:hypothetical protein
MGCDAGVCSGRAGGVTERVPPSCVPLVLAFDDVARRHDGASRAHSRDAPPIVAHPRYDFFFLIRSKSTSSWTDHMKSDP